MYFSGKLNGIGTHFKLGDKMNDFMTKEIELCGDDLSDGDDNSVVEIIYDALTNKGIDLTSFAWSINVEYLPQENDDE